MNHRARPRTCTPSCSNTTNAPVLATISVSRTGTDGVLELLASRWRVRLSAVDVSTSFQ